MAANDDRIIAALEEAFLLELQARFSTLVANVASEGHAHRAVRSLGGPSPYQRFENGLEQLRDCFDYAKTAAKLKLKGVL